MLKFRRMYYIFSGVLVSASIVASAFFGLNFGIDFTGGSLLEITITPLPGQEISSQQIEQMLENKKELALGDVRVQPTASSFIIRMRTLGEEEREAVLGVLKEGAQFVVQESFESIGPVIGKELKQKALWQLVLVGVGILVYIGWAFRKVSQLKEKSNLSWKFGIIALVALVHDCMITIGAFAVLGKFLAVEIDSSFIAAILLVLGYSVNDTIVVFDRIRENMIKRRLLSSDIEKIINESVSQTVVRSLNTSFTTLIVLFAVLFFGGQSTFYFVLALIIGIGVGTYSSIFLASPLLYEWEKK